MPDEQQTLLDSGSLSFGGPFFDDHAGHLITDPKIAIVELIANAYDACAKTVRITWPKKTGGKFAIADDGEGMTREELDARWRQLCYQRRDLQGAAAKFGGISRTPFGRDGKGRHSSFCFADSYRVETCKDKSKTVADVTLTRNSKEPFSFKIAPEAEPSKKHGTIISGNIERNRVGIDALRDLVGGKFASDPQFRIFINKVEVKLLDLEDLLTEDVVVPSVGTIRIHRIGSEQTDRRIRLRGITWWVNKRGLGEPSWCRPYGEGVFLDGRSTLAKCVSFIIEADVLKPQVKTDWTGFHDNERVNAVRKAADEHIDKALSGLMSSEKKERKVEVARRNRELLSQLPARSKKKIGSFLEETIQRCPRMTTSDLSTAVAVFAKLEESASGYALFEQLAKCSPKDLDTWNRLMSQWTASNAEVVLDELDVRLKLIARLEGLVGTKTTDELHDLQPLFARGLWIFGPKYEEIRFMANRAMATILRKFFKLNDVDASKRRPDFVALPEASLGAHAASSYGDDGEIAGHDKILVVELKKPAFPLEQEHVYQAMNYATEINKNVTLSEGGEIEVYVLGVSCNLEEMSQGHIHIRPRSYDVILRQAHARTFNLWNRLKAERPAVTSDEDIEAVLSGPVQTKLAFADG